LHDPHVRSLAWLLEAPDLLAYDAPQWEGKIGTLAVDAAYALQWLNKLDAHPEELHAWLNVHSFYRLGRYAERLMSFYFRHEGNLIAHGVQVKDESLLTIGEFDFLIRDGGSILHMELATKFYLLNEQSVSAGSSPAIDYFIGPNLADTLRLKMEKIIGKQLMLGQHPAAQSLLPEPVAHSRALIKGWLFYHASDLHDRRATELSKNHCRGFWCTPAELAERPEQQYLILPRLSWLPPAKADLDRVLDKEGLLSVLKEKFQHETMPVLVAVVDTSKDRALETDRGFIVPDDWQERAGQQKARP
jgi:hypothetical protein